MDSAGEPAGKQDSAIFAAKLNTVLKWSVA